MPRLTTVELTADELALLLEALDSHRYWQLSDKQYRSNGSVLPPGSDDAEEQDAIAAVDALETKLQGVIDSTLPTGGQ